MKSIPREAVEMTAHVMGPASVSAQLLKEADEYMSGPQAEYRFVQFFMEGEKTGQMSLVLYKGDFSKETQGS